MKYLIYDCLFFQSDDKETNIIGIVIWLLLIAFAVIWFNPLIFQNTENRNFLVY